MVGRSDGSLGLAERERQAHSNRNRLSSFVCRNEAPLADGVSGFFSEVVGSGFENPDIADGTDSGNGEFSKRVTDVPGSSFSLRKKGRVTFDEFRRRIIGSV